MISYHLRNIFILQKLFLSMVKIVSKIKNKQDAWNSLFKAFHEPSLLCTIVLHCIENFKHILHLTIYFVIHIFSAMNRMLFLFCLALVLKFINEVSIGCCWENDISLKYVISSRLFVFRTKLNSITVYILSNI